MPCMISFVNLEEYAHRQKDGFIKNGGVVKRYIQIVQGSFNKKSIGTDRTNVLQVI